MRHSKKDLEEVERVINGFYEEWGEQAGAIKPSNVERIDNFSPLFEAFRMIDDTLREDENYAHLTSDSRRGLNDALVDIANLIVRYAESPRYIVVEK